MTPYELERCIRIKLMIETEDQLPLDKWTTYYVKKELKPKGFFFEEGKGYERGRGVFHLDEETSIIQYIAENWVEAYRDLCTTQWH